MITSRSETRVITVCGLFSLILILKINTYLLLALYVKLVVNGSFLLSDLSCYSYYLKNKLKRPIVFACTSDTCLSCCAAKSNTRQSFVAFDMVLTNVVF